MSQQRVWLITGANSGFGTEFVHQILARGDKVIATGRNPNKLAVLANTKAHLLKLDVTSPLIELQQIAKEAVNVYGRIDVLVNNAGYIEMGTIEESTPEATFQQFNTNVFGLLNVTRAVLPYMRERRSGAIVNIGSVGGWRGFAGSGLYCASKFTVTGLSEALKEEVKPFGIEVHCIEPGYFATSLLTASNLSLNKNASIKDYEPLNKSLEEAFQTTSGNQPGDPVKGVRRMIEAVTHTGYAEGKEVPVRVVLGKDAYEISGRILERMQKERQEWKEWTEDSWRDDIDTNVKLA
jgi:NAD(P)-dependent dehydrogenase (short-subunit alcohol dehydrogenase family)